MLLPQLSAHVLGQQLPRSLQQQLSSRSRVQLSTLLKVLSTRQHRGDLGQQVFNSSRGIVTGHSHIPRVQHDRYRTAPRNYVQLLQHITRSRNVSDLSRLVQEYGKKFDAVHVAAAVAMMPKLYQPPAPGGHLNKKQILERKKSAARLLSQLQVSAASLVPRMFAGQVSSITYALARCSSLMPGGTAANTTTQHLVDTMLARLTKDQGRLLWQGAHGPAIKNLLHGIARLGYSPSSSPSSRSAAAAASQATQQLCRIIAQDPSRLHVRELATAAWSLARISRNRPGLLDAPSTAAALDAISAEVVARKLYLRPPSMTGLLIASAWLKRRDEALLAAVAEEAVHQLRDLRPPHLAAFAWAFSSLQYSPPPELTAGIVSESRRQLQHFTASSLGLLLQGLQQAGALDKQLLADIAAGIAAESQVSLAPRDAVRILAAFVAVPGAGSVRDVEAMAQLIAAAVRRQARNAAPAVITDLLVCYSKLPYHHPMLLALLDEARQRDGIFTLNNWVKLLQAAARLGYARVMADPAVETTLVGFYRAADARLQRHVRQTVLPAVGAAAGAVEAQAGAAGQQQEGLWSKLTGKGSQQEVQQDGEQQQQQQQAAKQRPLEVSAAVEVAVLLAQRNMLGEDTAEQLARAGVQLLPELKLRQLMKLLTAVTSRDAMLGMDDIRQFIVKASEHIGAQNLGNTPTATTTVLVGLLQPLSKAVSRNLALKSGEPVVLAIYHELLPVLEECSEQQLVGVWQAIRRSGLTDEALVARAKEIAQRNGWKLPSDSLTAA